MPRSDVGVEDYGFRITKDALASLTWRKRADVDDSEHAKLLRRTTEEMTETAAHPTDIGATLRGVTAACVARCDLGISREP